MPSIDPNILAAMACMQCDTLQLKALMTVIYNRNYDRFWYTPAENPDPVAMAAAFGSQGAKLVAQSEALANFINANFPGTIPANRIGAPTGWTMAVNATSGIVTITKAS